MQVKGESLIRIPGMNASEAVEIWMMVFSGVDFASKEGMTIHVAYDGDYLGVVSAFIQSAQWRSVM